MGNKHGKHGEPLDDRAREGSRSSGSGSGSSSGAGGTRRVAAPRVTPRSLPKLRPELAEEGRDLFRRFAAHLDRQTQDAPQLGTPVSSPGVPARRRTRGIGSSPESAAFVARFKWLEAVGAGSYSTVHRVQEKSTERILAIKCIKRELISPEVARQIDSEARLMEACNGQENIVELVDYQVFGSDMFFVLEYCPSTVLRTVIEENKSAMYSEAIAASIIRQTAAALSHIHSLGIVHLDIKPDNLLLSSGCTPAAAIGAHWFPDVKLADFGMAAYSPVRREVGTLFYVAPEILSEGWAETPADMWSLGVVLYTLLCGFPPFMPPKHRSERSIESKVTSGDYKFFSPYWDHVSDEAIDLVRRLLVVEPERRLTANEVLKHPWLRSASRDAMPTTVSDGLRKITAREKWQTASNRVRTMVRLAKAASTATAGPSVSRAAPAPPAPIGRRLSRGDSGERRRSSFK